MDKGTVRWFDAVKGIGFIARDRDGNEVAVECKGAKCSDPPAAPKLRKPRKRKKSPQA